MGLRFVCLALGFEFCLKGGDVLGSFVLGLLEAMLAIIVDGGELVFGLVSSLLEAVVAIVSDGG